MSEMVISMQYDLVTGGDKLEDRFLAEYQALVARAQTYNLAEMDMEPEGDPFWTDRELP